jgi:hypothetical protein
MSTLKWKGNKNWETFYHGAFENVKADLRNIVLATNNMAAAVRNRVRRDKNLSDLHSAEQARTNLNLIDDCSSAKMGSSPHHHDTRYMPKINDILKRIGELEDQISELSCQGMYEVKEVWLAGDTYFDGNQDDQYYWMGWGILDYDAVIRDYIEPHVMRHYVGQKYEMTFRVTATMHIRKEDPSHSAKSIRAKLVLNTGTMGYENDGSPGDAWSGGGSTTTLSIPETSLSYSRTITMYKSTDVVPPVYMGLLTPKSNWEDSNIVYEGGRFDVYLTKLRIDDKDVKLGVESNLMPKSSIHIVESEYDDSMHSDDGEYYWIGWGVVSDDDVLREFVEPHIIGEAKGQRYDVTFRIRMTMQVKNPSGQIGIVIANPTDPNNGNPADAWKLSQKKSISTRTDLEMTKTIRLNKSFSGTKTDFYIGAIVKGNATWEYQGGRIDIWLEGVKIDGVEQKLGE